MNVNGSSSIYSLWLKNIQYQNTTSNNNGSISSSDFSLGSDSVTISRAALNALLRSDGGMQQDAFAPNSGTLPQEMEDSLQELNESGVLNDDQLEAVRSALASGMQAPPPPPQPQGGQQALTGQLDSLVSAGTITEDQESAVLEALQPTAAASETTSPFQSILDELVESGTITTEQEDSITSALESARQAAPPPPPPRGGEQGLTNQLDSLVSAGTITEDQQSAILEALQSGYQAENDEADTSPFEEILSQLVSYATISEEQKDSILEAFNSVTL